MPPTPPNLPRTQANEETTELGRCTFLTGTQVGEQGFPSFAASLSLSLSLSLFFLTLSLLVRYLITVFHGES